MRDEGRFVTGADPEYLRAKKDEIATLHCEKVLADLHEVSQIASTGVGFIVAIFWRQNTAQEAGAIHVFRGCRFMRRAGPGSAGPSLDDRTLVLKQARRAVATRRLVRAARLRGGREGQPRGQPLP